MADGERVVCFFFSFLFFYERKAKFTNDHEDEVEKTKLEVMY